MMLIASAGYVRDGQMSALKGRIAGEKVGDGKWSASNLVTGAQYDIDVNICLT